MKTKFLIIITLMTMFLSMPQFTYANSNDDKEEIKKIYGNLYAIVFENVDISNIPDVNENKKAEALDYVISLYQKVPDSLEAYYATFFIEYLIGNSVVEKYNKLKVKHISRLSDPNFETPEKLVFLMIMASPWAAKSLLENKVNYLTVIEVLKKIKDKCNNKSYSALAAALLSFDDKICLEQKKFIVEIIPNSPIIPYIKGEIVYLENEKNPERGIAELQHLLTSYGNLNTPNNCKMSLEYYAFIANCYINANDYDNAKKYCDLIEKEDLNHWELRNIKSGLKYLKLNSAKRQISH